MFLEKNEFLNIEVTLLHMPLCFLQNSVDPGDFALKKIKCSAFALHVLSSLIAKGDSCV